MRSVKRFFHGIARWRREVASELSSRRMLVIICRSFHATCDGPRRRLAAVPRRRYKRCRAAETRLPTHWSETENIAWKTALPGRGPSSPIVVAGHVIVTCSSGTPEDRLQVLSISAATGKLEWRRQFWATGRTTVQPTTAVAAPTPASDGKRIFALFSSSDLVCLDLDGNLLWLRGLQLEHPAAGNDVGMASSPVVVGQTVIVQIESQGDSFAAGFDTDSGATRWLIARPRLGNWSSPIVLHGKSTGRRSGALAIDDGSLGSRSDDGRRAMVSEDRLQRYYIGGSGGRLRVRARHGNSSSAARFAAKHRAACVECSQAEFRRGQPRRPQRANLYDQSRRRPDLRRCGEGSGSLAASLERRHLGVAGFGRRSPLCRQSRRAGTGRSARRKARGDWRGFRSARRCSRRPPSPTAAYLSAARNISGRLRNAMETLEIHPVARPLDAVIRPPGSKSLTNRALIVAALAEGPSELRGALDSEDTRVMIDGLRRLGIAIERGFRSRADSDRRLRRSLAGDTSADLFVANSGTTIRFLTALAALGHGTYRLDGTARMRERPIQDLLDALGTTRRRCAERNGQWLSAGRRACGGVARRSGQGARRYFEPVSQRIVDGGPLRRLAGRIGNRRAAGLAAVYSHDARRDAGFRRRNCRRAISHAFA